MSAPKPRDHRRFRLATNDNEILVDGDVAGHALTRNDNETIVEDELDTEGHRLAANDSEIVVEQMRRLSPDDDEQGAIGAEGMRAR
jgi:hypothetical protein